MRSEIFIQRGKKKIAAGKNDEPTIFVRLSEGDALGLIESLASQLFEKNPNTNRREFFINGWYFTVSAHKDSTP